MARILRVVVYVREEFLQEGWHAGDASSDAIVKLQQIVTTFQGHGPGHGAIVERQADE